MDFFTKRCLLVFGAILSFGSTLQAATPEKPNIIVIMADDLGYGDLSCYRKGATFTPACNSIAKNGMLFTDAHSNSAVCTPTRYSLLTGRYNWRSYLQNWVLSERMPLLIEEGTDTLPAAMQRAGYETGMVGKWHLGFGRDMDAYQRGEFAIGPNAIGFDDFFGVPFSHNSTPEMEVFMHNDTIVGLPEGHTLWDPIGLTQARRSLEATAGDLSRAAVHFISQNKEKPFFLYYATTNVHFPVTPHPMFVLGQDRATFEGGYRGFVKEFDWAVGQVLNELETHNLLENTIVIVTSDNGGVAKFGGSSEPWRGEKAQIYEGGHRVPFLIQWPAVIEPKTTCDHPVLLSDLAETFTQLVGQEIADLPESDSMDMMPLFRGEHEGFDRGPIIHHSQQGIFAIRDGDWKYIDSHWQGSGRHEIGLKDRDAIIVAKPDGGYEDFSFRPVIPARKDGEAAAQLYNLKDDPKETMNLIARNPQKAKELKSLLESIKAGE